MARFKGGSMIVLEMVLNVTNEKERFDYSVVELKSRDCYNATKVKRWLRDREYIDEDKNLIKYIPTNDMVFIQEDIRHYRKRLKDEEKATSSENKNEENSKERKKTGFANSFREESLYKFLSSINQNHRITRETKKILKTNTFYRNHIISFLKDKKFIDKRNERLKPILLIESAYALFKNELSVYAKDKSKTYALPRKVTPTFDLEKHTLLKTKPTTAESKITLESFTEKQLVSELRKRGYEVKAEKIIKVKL